MRSCAVLALFALLTAAAPARAADHAPSEAELSARRHFSTGRALFEKKRWSDALDEFRAAQEALPSPAFEYNIAQCLERLDRALDAAEAFERYVRARPKDPEAPTIWRKIGDLRARAKEQEATRPPPPVVAPPPPVEQPLLTPPPVIAPLPSRSTELDRGLHDAELRSKRREQRIHQSRAAIALGTIGGLALIGGTALGAAALSKKGSYLDSCGDPKMPIASMCNQSLYDSAHALAGGADVLFLTGALTGVTAIILGATLPKNVAVQAGLGGGGVQVRF